MSSLRISHSEKTLVALQDALLGELLLGELLDLLTSRLGHLLALLREDELDVARRAHVRVNTTVGTVGAAAALTSALDGDVGNDL